LENTSNIVQRANENMNMITHHRERSQLVTSMDNTLLEHSHHQIGNRRTLQEHRPCPSRVEIPIYPDKSLTR
jgi:hypothetical protein